MVNQFFEKPVLNAPYACPVRHWELDEQGQPTQRIIESRRESKYLTPIPKSKKRIGCLAKGNCLRRISTEQPQYDPTPIINELRHYVDQWRSLPNPADWQVTPETARLLRHWRHHQFNGIRPFFCQIEAVETAIWLTEIAPALGNRGKKFLDI